MKIGVLALQGDYEAHAERLGQLNLTPVYVKSAEQLTDLDGLVLPGGESSAMLRLMTDQLAQGIAHVCSAGMAVLATCAGVILIAQNVTSPDQRSLGLIDIDVARNAYGRQLDSFVDRELTWTTAAKNELANAAGMAELDQSVEAIFIRAPKITRVGRGVTSLLLSQNNPVLVVQDNIFAATFHPELSQHSRAVYQFFLNKIR